MTEYEIKWHGAELARDLAQTLQNENWMTWVNIPLGSVMWSSPQVADVLAMAKSFAHPVLKIYEIKVSRGDFFGDINRMKYKGYFRCAHQVYFAVPAGMVKVNELPDDGVGLITRSDTGWHVVKGARLTDYELKEEILLKLLMKGYSDFREEWRSPERREKEVKAYTTLKQAYYDYGVKVARDIAEAQEIKVLAENYKREIGALLGKDYHKAGDAVASLKHDVDRLMKQYRGTQVGAMLAGLLERLFNGDSYYYDSPVGELTRILAKAQELFPEKKD